MIEFNLQISGNFNNFRRGNNGLDLVSRLFRSIRRIILFCVVMIDWKSEGEADDHITLQ